MKKLLCSMLVVLGIATSFILTGCGDKGPKAVSIEVKDGTVANTLVVNTTLDLSNLVITVKYDNDTTQDVAKNNEMAIVHIDNEKPGTQYLIVKYLGLETKYQIEVVDVASKVATEISVKEGTIKNTLIQNKNVDLSKLVLVVKYDDNTTLEVAKNDDMQIVDIDNTILGLQNLKITYLGLSVEFPIDVIKKSAVSISVKENTVAKTLEVGTQLDLSKLILVVAYNDGTTQDVDKNADMQITNINNAKLGKQNLKISYLDLETNYEIEVKEPDYTFLEFEQPENFTIRDGSMALKKDDPATANIDESEENFLVKDSMYRVGDDNLFKYQPIITVIDQEGNDKELSSYVSNVKVEQYKDGQYVEIVDNDLTAMVKVDNINSTFDFTELAVGNKFRITVSPTYSDNPEHKLTFIVEVVDGWNVYDAKDFAKLYNANGAKSWWKGHKYEEYVGDTSLRGLVLQNNIKLTIDDISSKNLYGKNDRDENGESLDGTFKDKHSLYVVDVPENEKFSIFGNYYTLDYDIKTYVKKFSEWTKVSHLCLIDVGGDDKNSIQSHNQGEFLVQDLKMLGNAGRSEDEKLKGGIIAFISSSKKFQFNNSIMRKSYEAQISLDPSVAGGTSSNEFNNSKFYDSYSTFFFAWDSRSNTFNRCVLKNSGGPLFLATDVIGGTVDALVAEDARYKAIKKEQDGLKAENNKLQAELKLPETSTARKEEIEKKIAANKERIGEIDYQIGQIRLDVSIAKGDSINHRPSNVQFNDCELGNTVNGSEGWFVVNNAVQAVAALKPLEGLMRKVSSGINLTKLTDKDGNVSYTIDPLGQISEENTPNTKIERISKGFMSDGAETKGLMNLVNIALSDNYVDGKTPIHGKCVVTKNGKKLADQNMVNPLISATWKASGEQLRAVPFFESNGVVLTVTLGGESGTDIVGLSVVTAEGLKDIATSVQNADMKVIGEVVKFFSGEFLNFYLPNSIMGATCEFYDGIQV